MTKIYKYFIWFYMLTKRLLCQKSFVILLCLIPCSIFLVNLSMTQEESGVVHIMLCSQDGDEKATEIIDSLMNSDTVIRFSLTDSEKKARDAVSNNKVDVAWIFNEDFSEKLENYVTKKRTDESFIKIIQREPSLPLNIAQEKLFGSIYETICFKMYKNFVYTNLVSEDKVPSETVDGYYFSMKKGGNIVQIERLNEKNEESAIKNNYLLAPIRGILSLMIVLCTLTAAMFYLKENTQRKFSWLPARKRIIPAFASCLSASCLSAVAVFITIYCTGISISFWKELLSMIFYIIAVTGFCLVLITFFKSPGKFGALIPGIIITMLVLSPIFFNVTFLKPIRLMLPSHYYLNSIYNPVYYLYFSAYCVVTYSLGFLLNYFFAERKSNDIIII